MLERIGCPRPHLFHSHHRHRPSYDAKVGLPIQGASSTRKEQSLAALASEEERTLYSLMTLFLQKLLVNEPAFDDDELDSSAVSSSHITSSERSDIQTFECKLLPTEEEEEEGMSLTANHSQGVSTCSHRRVASRKPTVPNVEATTSAPSHNRGSCVLSAKDDVPDDLMVRSADKHSSSSAKQIGAAAINKLRRHIANFDSKSLSLPSGRKAAIEAIRIVLDLHKSARSLFEGAVFKSSSSASVSAAAIRLSSPTSRSQSLPHAYRGKRRLYQIVQSFAVYANTNMGVRNEIADNVDALLEICFDFKKDDEEDREEEEEGKKEQHAAAVVQFHKDRNGAQRAPPFPERKKGCATAASTEGFGSSHPTSVSKAESVADLESLSFINPSSPCSPSARIPLRFPTIEPTFLQRESSKQFPTEGSSPCAQRGSFDSQENADANDDDDNDSTIICMSPTFPMNASFSSDPLSTPPSRFKRRIEEIAVLRDYLSVNNVPQSIVQELVECYALEMLVDAGLPPSVCSSRYEGVATTLWERRGRVVGTIIASRSVLTILLKAVTVQQMAFLMRLGTCVEPKGRARFYDRLISEGGMGLLLLTAREGSRSQLGEALNILATVTTPCIDGGGKVIAEGMDAGGAEGNAGSSPMLKNIHAKVRRPASAKEDTDSSSSLSSSPSSSMTSPSMKSSTTRCTAWAANPQLICELLIVLCSLIRKAGTRDPTLEPRMAEILENVMCYSRHTADIAVGVIGGLLSEGPSCPFIPMLFPAIVMYLRRREAVSNVAVVSEWFRIIRDKMVSLVAAARRVQRGGERKRGCLSRQHGWGTVSKRTRQSREPSGSAARQQFRGVDMRLLVKAVVPYLGFVRALLEETQWREELKDLLSTAHYIGTLIAEHNGRAPRPTLVSGVALHVLGLIEPLVDEIGLRDLANPPDGLDEDFSETSVRVRDPASCRGGRSVNGARKDRLGRARRGEGSVDLISAPSSPIAVFAPSSFTTELNATANIPAELSSLGRSVLGQKRRRSSSPLTSSSISPPRTCSARGRLGESVYHQHEPMSEAEGCDVVVSTVGEDESEACRWSERIEPADGPDEAFSPKPSSPQRKHNTRRREHSGRAAVCPPCLFGPTQDTISAHRNNRDAAESSDDAEGRRFDATPPRESVRESERVFYSLSRTPNEAAASPIAVVIPFRSRLGRDAVTHAGFADRCLDDVEDGYGAWAEEEEAAEGM